MADDASKVDDPVIIKKYANRRLYNTATSSYVTLDNLSDLVKSGTDFVVYDAKTNEDITRSVLTQIIFEEEAKGENLLPINFLRDLIRLYGNSLQQVVPGYLEMSMEAFRHNQDQMAKAFDGSTPLKAVENLTRQNMALFQQTMSMFNPFTAGARADQQEAQSAEAAQAEADDIADLKEQLAQMQAAINALNKG